VYLGPHVEFLIHAGRVRGLHRRPAPHDGRLLHQDLPQDLQAEKGRLLAGPERPAAVSLGVDAMVQIRRVHMYTCA